MQWEVLEPFFILGLSGEEVVGCIDCRSECNDLVKSML